MTLECVFKGLLFSVFFLLCQQALANDTFDLEEFRAQASTSSPFKNIRIGFFGLNLTDDGVSGDDRLEIHNDFVIDPQNIEYLSGFYWHYVNTGDPQYQQARILKALRLIFLIFTINMTINTSPKNQEQIKAMVTSLYEQVFSSATTSNNESNPYYVIFNQSPEKHQPEHSNLYNSLTLMLFSFLGPYALPMNTFSNYFNNILIHRITLNSYRRAKSNFLMSGHINNYLSPQRFANQLTTANLNTETALILGLSSMTRAAQECMDIDFDQSWPETLEELLQRFLPCYVLQASYEHMNNLCQRPYRSAHDAIYSDEATLEFIYQILGLDLRPSSGLAEEGDSCSEDPDDQSSLSSQDYELLQDNYFPEGFSPDYSSDNEGTANETEQEAGAVGGVIIRDLRIYFSYKDQ
ncbi:hypothetical protein [Endozoicomonas sp. 4G]|uniref:hypothetical protein n=1 Tax=Endozoicomonas sp. 4G TaxID=2872754 RepID=UPI002078D4D4|nr:hypothetical protein [Endozoicomonas sp. 4G]